MWYLDNIDLYHILCPHKVKGYTKDHFTKHKKNDIIYNPSIPDNKLYLISKGKVKIVNYTPEGHEIIKAILTKGELFGVAAILGDRIREDEAIAMTDNTQLCPLTVDKMYELMRDNGRFSLEISKIIGFRLKKMERRLERLLFKDARTRLIEFIIDLLEEQPAPNGNETVIDHVYTQSDIANLIGTTRETVTKLLNQLKNDGILSYSRKTITLHKIDELMNMSPR